MDRFEIPLDIEDVKIEAVEFTPNNEIIITVKSTVEGTIVIVVAIKSSRRIAKEERLPYVIYRF